MQGMIVLWSGAIVDIPTGWHLCDGTTGTPDLRDRFIVGAGTTYNPGDAGGANTHTHTFTGDGHSHLFPAGSALGAGPVFDDNTASTQVTGTTDASNNLPPYYALAYIMKI